MYLEPEFVSRVPEGTQVLFLRRLTSSCPQGPGFSWHHTHIHRHTHRHTYTSGCQIPLFRNISSILPSFPPLASLLHRSLLWEELQPTPPFHTLTQSGSCRNVLKFLVIGLLFFLLKVFFFFFFPLLESIGIFIWKSGGEQVKCLLHSYLKTETISLASSPCW